MNHMTAPSPAIARKLAQLAGINANLEKLNETDPLRSQRVNFARVPELGNQMIKPLLDGKTDFSNAKIISRGEAIPPVRPCKHARRQPHPPFPPIITDQQIAQR